MSYEQDKNNQKNYKSDKFKKDGFKKKKDFNKTSYFKNDDCDEDFKRKPKYREKKVEDTFYSEFQYSYEFEKERQREKYNKKKEKNKRRRDWRDEED